MAVAVPSEKARRPPLCPGIHTSPRPLCTHGRTRRTVALKECGGSRWRCDLREPRAWGGRRMLMKPRRPDHWKIWCLVNNPLSAAATDINFNQSRTTEPQRVKLVVYIISELWLSVTFIFSSRVTYTQLGSTYHLVEQQQLVTPMW